MADNSKKVTALEFLAASIIAKQYTASEPIANDGAKPRATDGESTHALWDVPQNVDLYDVQKGLDIINEKVGLASRLLLEKDDETPGHHVTTKKTVARVYQEAAKRILASVALDVAAADSHVDRQDKRSAGAAASL